MTNEDGSVFVVYNGEIFNHLALRGELEARGHLFRTRSDTEVLVHAYEQWGERMRERLNGQFAFAIYDRRAGSLFLARDRFGILPLYYTARDGDLYFGSEVKALLATGEVERTLDPEGLDEVFTFWAARAPRTPFRGIRALEPGCCARWQDGRLAVRRYYAFDCSEAASEPADALDALDDLLRSAVRLRLQADVPVGGYLSGGIDSSIVCALAAALAGCNHATVVHLTLAEKDAAQSIDRAAPASGDGPGQGADQSQPAGNRRRVWRAGPYDGAPCLPARQRIARDGSAHWRGLFKPVENPGGIG